MKDALIDVPVALIFFNRPEPLKKVFEQIKIARPSKLYLIQDGPRVANLKDIANIKACREVVSNIDWDCEVHRDYSEKNLATGMRIYSGITKVFENEDRLIILEDDCVPSQSFFRFCEELLEKYQYDERINMISGMNHLNEHNLQTSYFFSERGAIWGWATWKRVWDLVDYNASYVKDNYVMSLLNKAIVPMSTARILKKRGERVLKKIEKGEKLSAWSYQFRMVRHLYNQLVIVPNKNLISNIGITEETVHARDSLKKLPKGIHRVFFMKVHELEFPLVHPKFYIKDRWYDDQIEKILGEKAFRNFYRKFESAVRYIIYR